LIAQLLVANLIGANMMNGRAFMGAFLPKLRDVGQMKTVITPSDGVMHLGSAAFSALCACSEQDRIRVPTILVAMMPLRRMSSVVGRRKFYIIMNDRSLVAFWSCTN